MTMKTVLSIVAAAAVALLSTQSFAQDKTRAEVKAEAKEANKKHETPAGEAGMAPKDGKSTKARAEVKAEAKDANKKHETPAGEAGMASKDAKGTKARADVKAETKDAAKKKELTPAGEAGAPAKK
jgi:Domain of unknown function (DUF4148)